MNNKKIKGTAYLLLGTLLLLIGIEPFLPFLSFQKLNTRVLSILISTPIIGLGIYEIKEK